MLATVLLAAAGIRIAEICPKPIARDANDRESGWVELVNVGSKTENLKNYELQRFNRGKKASAGKFSALPSQELAPGARALIYTSEEYDNAEDLGGDGATVKVYNGLTVAPFKVNPKKYPMVRLLKGKTVIDSYIVPVDIGDDRSFAPADESYESGPVRQVILPHPTRGTANNYTDAIAYGPNAGPLYGIKHSLSDWKAFPQAVIGEAYPVTLAINPLSSDPANAIETVTLRYRLNFGEVATVPMTKGAVDASEGQLWTAEIPGSAIPEGSEGALLRWAATIVDGTGATWATPSFCSPDDGYEWYGTIVTPKAEQVSAKLTTLHLFVEPGNHMEQMDKDADSQDLTKVPYNARTGIYDQETGYYYDNVRIDLRGNASAGFKKKSHGLKFSKSQPFVGINPFDGAEIECRKSSFIAEYCDPSKVRQTLGFKVFRDMGAPAPFDYPVRLNRNGEFYQLAFHSERFTDELIEDHYGFDKYGYSYKNVGTFKSLKTDAGAIEKKTPDDGNESDLSMLKPFIDSIAGADAIGEKLTGEDGMASEIPAVTKTVVQTFDLPAWINYLAAARITQEADDVNANLSAYYDVNGTGTWMPLAYDFHVAWGTSYGVGFLGKRGEMADLDWFKSHPFFSGNRVRAHQGASSGTLYNYGNRAVEAVWQSPKFRRLYLRRLRSVMDQVLKEPGTTREATPFWEYVTSITNAISADLDLDHKKWGYTGSCNYYIWSNSKMELPEAIESLWTNYVEPRRTHLYITHAVTNTARQVGYGRDFIAGIPEAQAPTAELKGGFSIANVRADGRLDPDVLVLRNANETPVDLTGWKLSGAIKWTFPAGAVVDSNDVIIVTRDRKAYIEAQGDALTDQVIVGNAEFVDLVTKTLTLKDADGVKVLEVKPPAIVELGEAEDVPGTDYCGSTVTISLGEDFSDNGNKMTATLTLDNEAATSYQGVIDAEAKTVTFTVESADAPASNTVFGTIAVSDGRNVWKQGAQLEQGTLKVLSESTGWVRERAEDLGQTGAWAPIPALEEAQRVVDGSTRFTPTAATPEGACVTFTSQLELGYVAGGSFDQTAQTGVMVVADEKGDCHYAFWTGSELITNAAVLAQTSAEATLVVTIDYRRQTATYTINGEHFGPFKLSGAPTRVNDIELKGRGAFARLDGDYEVQELDANLAKIGETEYANIASAVAAGGRVELLWDASWNPEKAGKYRFITNGKNLVLGGELPAKIVKGDGGRISVYVAIEPPKPLVIIIR